VLPIDDVAHAAGTIGYELMCALAPRVPVRVDVEVAHGELADAVERAERLVLHPLHAQALGLRR
jgi:hypothetical protein